MRHAIFSDKPIETLVLHPDDAAYLIGNYSFRWQRAREQKVKKVIENGKTAYRQDDSGTHIIQTLPLPVSLKGVQYTVSNGKDHEPKNPDEFYPEFFSKNFDPARSCLNYVAPILSFTLDARGVNDGLSFFCNENLRTALNDCVPQEKVEISEKAERILSRSDVVLSSMVYEDVVQLGRNVIETFQENLSPIMSDFLDDMPEVSPYNEEGVRLLYGDPKKKIVVKPLAP